MRQLIFQETLLPGLPAGERDSSLDPDDGRTGWHFSFFSLPNLPELLLAGRERPFWTYFARRQMWDPSALTEGDIGEMVHSVEQPGGTRAILEMYRARQVDAEQRRALSPSILDRCRAPRCCSMSTASSIPTAP